MPIDFRVRDYLAPLALPRLQRHMERMQWAEPEEWRGWQLARLRELLGHAQRHVPHWRELFAELDFEPRALRDIDDLRRIPSLNKAALRARPERLVAIGRATRRARWHATSGTSGQPLRFLLDRRAQLLEFCYYRRCWSWGGYRLGQPFAELGGHHFLVLGRDPERLLQWQAVPRRLMINTNRLSPADTPELVRALGQHRPRFLKGLPSALRHLARCLAEAGGVSYGFQAVFSGGEVVTASARREIEAAFACRLFDSYGHMERTVAASQCEEGRYHVHEDYGLLELRELSPAVEGPVVETPSDDTPDAPRLAQVLGTGLHNRAMPLVRYELGDTVELMPEEASPCPCGRSFRQLAAIHGRSGDVITTLDGRCLSALTTAFDHVKGIETLQLVQPAPDVLQLRVVPGASWCEAARSQLEDTAARALGPGMRFELGLVERGELITNANGKLRPVVSLSADESAASQAGGRAPRVPRQSPSSHERRPSGEP